MVVGVGPFLHPPSSLSIKSRSFTFNSVRAHLLLDAADAAAADADHRRWSLERRPNEPTLMIGGAQVDGAGVVRSSSFFFFFFFVRPTRLRW
jgi:hypothetical protein